MTTHPDTQNDLQDLEAQFRSELVLSPEAQDLLFREARTANTFTDEPVSEEQVRAIYDLAKWAPTSMNNQPLRIVLVRSPEARGRLVETMAGGNKAKTSTAPLVAILATDLDFHEEFPRTFPHFPGARDMFAADDAMRAESATLNGTLQVAYFILAVRAAGLAAGPMTGYDAEALNREFFPDRAHRVLAVVNIGRPGESAWMDRLPRLDYDDVVTTV
jgi:3-hydroxypropanoate dehydrogenase